MADAGFDRTLECVSPAGVIVVLDGTRSSDPNPTPGTEDGIALFEWFSQFGAHDEVMLGSGEVLEPRWDSVCTVSRFASRIR